MNVVLQLGADQATFTGRADDGPLAFYIKNMLDL